MRLTTSQTFPQHYLGSSISFKTSRRTRLVDSTGFLFFSNHDFNHAASPPTGSHNSMFRYLSMHRLFCIFLLTFAVFSLPTQAAEKKVSVVEAVFDSNVEDIQWLGSQYKVVLCRTRNGGFYRSQDSGRTWTDASKLLKPATQSNSASIKVESIHLHPNSRDIAVITGKGHTHFITTNKGETFRPLAHQGAVHGFLFHPTRLSWALLSLWTEACSKTSGATAKDSKGSCRHDLYFTQDYGASFRHIASFIVQYSWGDPTRHEEDAIYFSQYTPTSKTDSIYKGQPRVAGWSKHIDFKYMASPSAKIKTLLSRGNKFLISNGYIFVARLVDEQQQTVVLMVSRDGGKTFKEALLPVTLQEKSYSILDTSDNSVIVHVNHGHPSHNGILVGDVYTSDTEGLRYSLSLPKNIRSSYGECEFDKIASLTGLYIANYHDDSHHDATNFAEGDDDDDDDDEDDDTEFNNLKPEVQKRKNVAYKAKKEVAVKTVISFDKGGAWSYLTPPRIDSRGHKISCGGNVNDTNNPGLFGNSAEASRASSSNSNCWLHLHGITNYDRYAPFYCIENAVGLVMGTGNVGPYLRYEQDQVNTYLSRDGGLTWNEVHKGAYIYEFGDHGGLIVMADDTKATNQVVFSWNEGHSWYDFDLGEEPVNVDNIVIEPNSSSVEFLLYGTRGTAGVLYHMDFEALGQPLCKGPWAADSVASDYQTWTPTDGRSGDQCILGKKLTFTRKKATSECFNGRDFSRPIEQKNCTCTERDYECEFGFTRLVNTLQCVPKNKNISPIGCTSSGIFWVDSYRKIPGDTCVGGWTPPKVPIVCPYTSPFSKRARVVLISMPLIVGAVGLWAYLSNNDRARQFLNSIGLERFSPSTAGYAVLGTAARLVYSATDSETPHHNPDASKNYAGYTHAGTASGSARGFAPLGYTNRHDTVQLDEEAELQNFVDEEQQHGQDQDDDDAPPLLDFSAASANGFHYVNHPPRPAADQDLFFMSSATPEQLGSDRYQSDDGTLQDVPYGGVGPSSSGNPLPAQPIPRLHPPPYSGNTKNANGLDELEML